MADLSFFVGRMHPLVVHLPIGMLVLLAVIELAGWRCEKRRLPAAVRTVMLLVAVVSAALAAGCGWLLARDGGYDETLLARHRWLGVGTAGLACVLLLVRRWSRVYGMTLVATVAALALAGHDGGSLTHGRGYLAEGAPSFLRPLFGGRADGTSPPASIAEARVYPDVIHPMLSARCISCHGESKSDGDLRLDSFAALLDGGKNGTVFKPGDPAASLILRRLYLPLGDKKHMPPAGRPQPTEADLAVIAWWIEQGGSEDARVADLTPTREMATLLAEQLGLPPPPVPDRDATLLAAAKLESELGIVIRPLSANEPWLAANARLRGADFGDEQLAALRTIAPALHHLDLGGTAITDAGLVYLQEMNELRRLQLDATAISDTGLLHLEPLVRLESLSLHTTAISDAGLESLRILPRLRRLYLWQTAVTSTAAKELAVHLENRRKLQRYRQDVAALERKLAAETFQIDFGVELPPVPSQDVPTEREHEAKDSDSILKPPPS